MSVKVVSGKAKDGGFIVSGIHITRRELEILSLVAGGLENEEIAKKCKISTQTVRNHIYHVSKKLNAKNRAHAISSAVQQGMLLIDYELVHGGKPKGKYLWCLHCERTYKYGEFRMVRIKPFVVDGVRHAPEYQMCPYEDCDGDTVLDAWEWEDIRGYHPEYPEIPEAGKVYPMY